MTSYLDGLSTALGDFLVSTAILVAAAAVGWLLYRLLFRVLRSVAARTETRWDDVTIRHVAVPSKALAVVLLVNVALPATAYAPGVRAALGTVLGLALVAVIAWIAVAALRAGQEIVLEQYDTSVADNLQARKVHTQIDIVRKILTVLVAILALAAMLLQFDRLREIGTGILASAGLAGVILGFAAQRTLSNLLAGFQLALTQPIRIDDVLVVEGEWGRVEEITLTYVVVRIWDERRLVLPISHFIEKPFQNWTRTSAEILGTVHLQLDYTVPVEDVRRKLGDLLEASEHWDGEVWRLHTTDSTARTLELRALMSARDSATAWELRCEIREKIVAWLREEHPEALPRVRATLGPDGPSGPGGGAPEGREEAA